ncbi:MAG: RNA polymerase subunit sigma-70 [Betaproteobacteria bacterium]|nr:MAG: RNA polymerase subunit sigma-70 [Betaproteobacteria bacterium]
MALDSAKQLERNTRLTDLLARAAVSDQQAFAELYRLTSSHLYAVALRILREPAAAEEVLQESYVNIWHHAGSYVAAKSQPLTWLTSIVRNRCLDHLRRREIDTITIVKGCVDALEAEQKQAIALAFYQGLSHAELSRHLKQPLGTVKSWVRRGLERLKACLDGAGIRR